MNRETCLENWPHAHVGEFDPRCCRFPKSCSIPDADAPIPAARTITEAEARILDAAKAYVEHCADDDTRKAGHDAWTAMRQMRRAQVDVAMHQAYGGEVVR